MESVILFDDLLTAGTSRHGNAVAVCDRGETCSYATLHLRVGEVAAGLQRAGVKRGDRVGIHLPKSLDEIIFTFATSRLGAIFVNVNYSWTAEQLEYVIKDCGIEILLTDVRRMNSLKRNSPFFSGVRIYASVGLESEGAEAPLLKTVPGVIDADLAALLYTSGSTGKPKGVMLTHRNLIAGAQSVASYLQNTCDDRILSILPLSFDYGLSQVTTSFLSGASVVLQPVMMAAEILSSIREHGITGVAAVPTIWVQLVKYLAENDQVVENLRYVTNSGGKIPRAVLEQMPRVFPGADIFLMYGLTEAFRSSYLPPELFREKMGSMGRAIPNVELFVVNDETGVCGPGEEGELVHRGSLIGKGYWGNPEATAEKIRPNTHLRHLIGDEPVLHSGDLVEWDNDGFLWFVGRADGLIKCSGFRISPEEVEDHFFRMNHVKAVAAFGVPDEILGEAVHVAVCVDPFSGEGDGWSELERGFQRACRQSMPNYMVPRTIHLWEGTFPLTSSGKLDRPRIKGTLLSGIRNSGE